MNRTLGTLFSNILTVLLHPQTFSGAQELVENYWKLNTKKGKRKSLEPKRARKSTAPDQESDTSVAKKRGRKSTTKADSDQDEDSMKNKRVRKGATKGQVHVARGIEDMTQYMDQESWEDLIDTVDTVERTSEGILFVYFTLYGQSSWFHPTCSHFRACRKTGENIKERSEICRQRFPQQVCFNYHFKGGFDKSLHNLASPFL